jgi:hypothetical protein
MQADVQVYSVLMQLQQATKHGYHQHDLGLLCGPCRHTSTAGSEHAPRFSLGVDAVLQLPCSCMQGVPAQLPGPQHNYAHARAGQAACNSSRPAQAVPAHDVLLDSLSLACRHFCGSVGVLACSQATDSLALAAEKSAWCAAGLSLIAATWQRGARCAASPTCHEQGYVAAVVTAPQDTGSTGDHGSALSCCGCSVVLLGGKVSPRAIHGPPPLRAFTCLHTIADSTR